MKKLKIKKSIVALWIIVPIATALAFVPKIVAVRKKRKYTQSF